MTGGWNTSDPLGSSSSLAERRRFRSKTAPATSPQTHLTPLQPEHTGGSTSTTHTHSTSADPNSSSIGKSAGKKMISGGIARLVGGSHGPFPFEPPVPSPTTSNMSVSTKDSAVSAVEKLKEKHRQERERERQREREREIELELVKQQERQRGRAAVKRASLDQGPPPLPPLNKKFIPSHRPKNRSLDLELGLSWAPTKIRETALLPFGKGRTSFSASSRNGLRRELDERSQIGKEIADEFCRVLDEDGYALFKHCESYFVILPRGAPAYHATYLTLFYLIDVHCFDAHEIPIDGPTGIIAHAERLLDTAGHISLAERRQLLDRLVRIILQRA